MRQIAILGRVDRYLIAKMAPRMVAALLVTLVILLIERLLRLLDFITGHGSDVGPVLMMMLSLLPHYMGLALPAAFCIGALSAMSQLSRDNEIDALEAAGWSLRRIGAPLVGFAVILGLLSILLFGIIQPYSRYAFNELRHAISTAGWDGRVEQGVFFDVGDGLVVSAGDVDASGRVLYRVFIVQQDGPDETVITAEKGVVVPSEGGLSIALVLQNGIATLQSGTKLEFDSLQLDHEFDGVENPFRPRGGSERELTLLELWDEMHMPQQEVEPRFRVEFHDRIVRAVSLIGIALLSVPLSVSRKRVPSWRRILLAVAVLAVFDNLLKMAGGYAKLGYIDPALSIWGVCALFLGLALWLFVTTPSQGAMGPIRWSLRLFDRTDTTSTGVGQQS